ncbi:DUF2786 domain-containing protein [Phytoactinopolyspora endophytica]|uniref:DUF2786 domain-containing protein n=1 Tax=Phytoactinopolyspora endophytica TaxID=1642495 RepID=UPI00101CE85F|nr:DUF2786 domain-containing protein [Phytoactinopolyspora endophytica]
MGQRNKEKRAAKKRKRQRRGPTPPRDRVSSGPHGPDCTCDEASDFSDPPPGPTSELLSNTLLAAAQTHADGDPSAAAACARELAEGPFADRARMVSTAAGMAIGRILDQLWHAGWLPTDVWELIRRRLDSAATSLVVDAIAADTAQHAAATVDERWATQVRQLEATVWWDHDSPHLMHWAERIGVTLEAALLCSIGLLAELMVFPKLPQILPPPGTATRATSASAAGVDQKVLARVRGLLAKAESTQFPEEAEALSAKAQELMNRHAFERALVDADTHKQQVATSIRLWLDSPYVDAKSHLVAAVAKANRCRSVFYPKIGFVALVGEEMDLEIAELLVTSLLVQATHAMVAEGKHVTYTGTSRTRSFRRSFLVSYAVRIGERLDEAAANAHDPAEDARLLPVLADRSRVVEETFQQMFSHTVERSTSVTNGAGWNAGRAAADRADLGVERRHVTA